MKLQFSKQRNRALTRTEVVVMVAVIAVLILIWVGKFFTSDLRGLRQQAWEIHCVNNVKQVANSFRTWAGDHNDKFPTQTSVTNGGAMELAGGVGAWKTFQVMSNLLGDPKALICPADRNHPEAATNFSADLQNKISYFVSLVDTNGNWQETFLSGDDNFLINGSPVKPGLIEMVSNTPVAWNSDRHFFENAQAWFFKNRRGYGNIALCDGSVQSFNNSNLTNQLHQTGLTTNRLAIP